MEFIFYATFSFLHHFCVLFIPESEGGAKKTPDAAAAAESEAAPVTAAVESEPPQPLDAAADTFGSPASNEAAEGEEESPGDEVDPLCEVAGIDVE